MIINCSPSLGLGHKTIDYQKGNISGGTQVYHIYYINIFIVYQIYKKTSSISKYTGRFE